FIEGREADRWREDPAGRREVVLQAFARFFGPPAATPERYLDHDWTSELWSRGCYAGVAGPGVVSTLARSARRAHGRVHWAGTETATEWTGYIEGAIRSGIRAAQEIGDV